MLSKIKVLCCCFAVLSAVFLPGSVFATQVGTELVLLADISGSVDSTDFALQRDGYVAAFRDPTIINAIQSEPGGIAVTFVYWTTGQYQVVGWTHITDAVSSNAFADAIAAAGRPTSGGSTNMALAMNYAGPLFNNGYESTKQIVDVSGDGANQDGVQIDPAVQAARDNLVNNFGVDMINALWIHDRNYFGDVPGVDMVLAIPYGIDNVIYGAGSFSRLVDNYADFEVGVKDKIFTEIHGAPEPATMILLGAGLLGLWGFRKKFHK